ncbi:hypothetical protein B9Q02_01345 [Candidatus Marsarchaeota G1 archaeon BE_D]|jgi:6-pyruvoyl-tetrahydropterin synthase|uniref:6-pyruvoyl tetrahydropterin synthase n=1 Tax=Candidatus Marsarchaeota G1 archaeon BE_D TaxID=1978156 RepID=A0A2R6AJV4_9ARCH|nr:MAG: hypothetical protein B9Q02_01345 [Candidatus Marsarchaeota G1 archaeon BE_D]
MFFVSVDRRDLHFSSAHFIYSENFREPLHGHNYEVRVEVEGELGDSGFVINFLELKALAKSVLEKLDHKVLLPLYNPLLKVYQPKGSDELEEVRVEGKFGECYSIPKRDIALVPIKNTSAEELAEYILNELLKKMSERRGITSLSVEVYETPAFSARKAKKINTYTL